MDYLDSLNKGQKEAVLHKDGPLLIVAGAGAGKTKTLTSRIFHLIKQGVAPDQILAVTFTNKAAREMRERVMKLLGIDQHGNGGLWALTENPNVPFVSTFHSLGVYILRKHGEVIGLPKSFSIIDKDDSLKLIKEAIKASNLDPKQWEPRKISNAISKQKGAGIDLDYYRAKNNGEFFAQTTTGIWEKYERALKEQAALDFDDLLIKTITVLEKPEVLAYYQDRFRYVHIDEYQDTNTAQYQIAKLLSGKYKNICVVGDVDQSIYSWRGADFRNILNFEKDYPKTKVITLEENYRSTQNILLAANEVIKKNKERLEKNLFTRNAEGEQISLIVGFDEGEEAYHIANTALQLIKSGVSADEIAVLYRANFQSRVLEEAFLRQEVSYRVLGVRFFDRKEIKDLMSFLRAAANDKDIEAFKRLVGVMPTGIGKVTLAKLFTHGVESLPKAAQAKIAPIRTMLAEINQAMKDQKPSDLVKFTLARSGLEKALKQSNDEDLERLENLRELVSLATKYDVLPPEEAVTAFMTDTALMSADEENNNGPAVRLMTVHAAKGLEYDYVFIAGLEGDLFPHIRMGEDAKESDSEEERRLFYVAITRARKKVYLCYAQLRTIFGSKRSNQPSEFIFDIPEHLIDSSSAGSPTRWITLD